MSELNENFTKEELEMIEHVFGSMNENGSSGDEDVDRISLSIAKKSKEMIK